MIFNSGTGLVQTCDPWLEVSTCDVGVDSNNHHPCLWSRSIGATSHQGPLLKAAYLELEMQWDDLGSVCSCFSAVF
jgi:hypothetical protein